MVRFSVALLALVAAVSASSPVAAQTVAFNAASSGTDGTDGNIRAYSSGAIQVQASAWSYNGTTLQQSFLGQYGSNGVGVTNPNEGNGATANSHTTDNVGQYDFILLLFNQAVNISSARLNPYSVSTTPTDNDAYISYASAALPFTVSPTAVPLASSVFASLLANGYNVSGNNVSPYSTVVNSSNLFGNVWVIGAARTNPDANSDGFKLASVTVSAAVPEPSTWAMMLMGFGAIGVASRRRRKTLVLAQAV